MNVELSVTCSVSDISRLLKIQNIIDGKFGKTVTIGNDLNHVTFEMISRIYITCKIRRRYEKIYKCSFQGEAEKNYKAILFESILKVITLQVKDLIHAIFDLLILY